MNKGLGLLVLGVLAVLGGIIFAALVIKNKFNKDYEIDFDDFEDYELIVDEDGNEVKAPEKETETANDAES